MKARVTVVVLASVAQIFLSGTAQAQERQKINLYGWIKGDTSAEWCFEGLCVRLATKRINVNGDKSEICATLHNDSEQDWAGGFRLTGDLYEENTHMSLEVDGKSTVTRCEILPNRGSYSVVLRQDE